MRVADCIEFFVEFVRRESAGYLSDVQNEISEACLKVKLKLVTRDDMKTLYEWIYYFSDFNIRKKEFSKSERINNIKPEDRNNLMVLYTIF